MPDAEAHRTHRPWKPQDVADCSHPRTLPLSRDRSICTRCRFQWEGTLVRENGVQVASVGRP